MSWKATAYIHRISIDILYILTSGHFKLLEMHINVVIWNIEPFRMYIDSTVIVCLSLSENRFLCTSVNSSSFIYSYHYICVSVYCYHFIV